MSSSQDGLPPPSEDGAPPLPPLVPEDPQAKFPLDLRTPWGWRELIVFAVISFAALVVLSNLLAVAAITWWKVNPGEIQKFAATSGAFISVRLALWYGWMILYLFALFHYRRRRPFWLMIGWRQLPEQSLSRSIVYLLCLLGGVLLASGIQFASLFLRTKEKLPIEALFHDRRSVLWLMAIGILLAPLVEETIFRGYLYPVLARSFGVEGGVLVTGLLFGLLHAPQLWGGWGQIGLLAVVGIVLTYARARSRTVVTSYLLHLGYNSFLFLGFYFYTGGLRYFPPGP